MQVRAVDRHVVAVGGMRAVTVAGTKVAIAHVGERFFAFDDTCTHMGCSLADGELDGTTVTCACHGSQFDVTSGEVLHGPAEDPVRSRAVTIDGDEVMVEA